jgi:5-(carboxyamino)imidazole ribonucleotide synthase
MTDGNARSPLPPRSTIGILGGGQLGRMTAMAAARLGYRVHILCPEPEPPAADVAFSHIRAAYDDNDALDSFAAAVDVATYEFEHLPLAAVRRLSGMVPVKPDWRVLEVGQDRLQEKAYLNRIGIPTAAWRPVASRTELTAAVNELGAPSVLKTAKEGYDGKGQAVVAPPGDASACDAAWHRVFPDHLDGRRAILESYVPFDLEISVIVARSTTGDCVTYDPVHNTHRNHVLDTTVVPAPVAPSVADRAREIARAIAGALDVVGVLGVEMFVTGDGAVLVNEIAPRPHNSGHWTIDACLTDQFEQLVRAICGLPLGSPARFADARMKNLLGEDVLTAHEHLNTPGARLHLYGKASITPGRKMGHVTLLSGLDARPED